MFIHLRISLVFIISALLVVQLSNAQNSKLLAPENPRLIICLTVSQFRSDYISRYWDKFEDDGFKRLANRGINCKNASYSNLLNDKGVGNATISTGTNPSGHGIVGSSWYDDLRGKIIPSVYDESVSTVGGPFEAGQCSPRQLFSTTFSDELKLSNTFKSKVISISLEPVSSVLSGGHTADAAYWFDIQNGNFISSSYYMDSLAPWVNDFNLKKIPSTYLERIWEPIHPLSEYTESLPDNNKFEEGYKSGSTFPYEVKDLIKAYKRKEEFAVLNTIPFGDNLVKDFAIQAIVNEELGKDFVTDVLFVNFTSLEQIGNLFGPLSVEVEDAVLRLDRELAHFLDFIDSEIGIENTLVIFTAEHGLNHRPEYLEANKIPSGYFNSSSAISLLTIYLNNIYGKGDWIKQYNSQQIYLNRTLIESADLKLSDFQDNVANLMLQFTGVQNTITSTALLNNYYIEGVFRKIQNGYNQKRSGDVILHLNNGYLEKQGKTIISMGSDTRVPLFWYGWKTGKKDIFRPVDITDIAPTISVLLDISYPNSSTGTPIEEVIR
ncbi:MAG: alkaline phosphatase family protein [Bacteroidales bacterium]|nr:alkaline phosphatase family protein [Bacteroidales bacterium]MBN2819335.1 alkaline phosphatase family protein [Bacteroidales bacterium]